MKVYRLKYNNLWKNIVKKSEDDGQIVECE